ncbi:hypothetical protein TCAP_02094 [Tolypocladium capitatum]|uniref:Uncharacterized protein n=1 Tax=Tolypocladium capitatum TaxID=45235 RepID=A0A2K3QKD1_9HYPO|nr:hypothetical protein TCAP_02094 [Tolypocladium capitatum]
MGRRGVARGHAAGVPRVAGRRRAARRGAARAVEGPGRRRAQVLRRRPPSGRLVGRDHAGAAGHPLQAHRVGPRRDVRRGAAEPQVHGCQARRARAHGSVQGTKVSVRPGDRLWEVRVDAVGGLAARARRRLRPAEPPDPTALAPDVEAVHGPLGGGVCIVPRLSPPRAIPDAPRQDAKDAPRTTDEPGQPRGLVRVPQPPARLARLHRVPALRPAPHRHQPMAPLARPDVAQDQGDCPLGGRRRRRRGKGRIRVPARADVRHLLPGPRRRGDDGDGDAGRRGVERRRRLGADGRDEPVRDDPVRLRLLLRLPRHAAGARGGRRLGVPAVWRARQGVQALERRRAGAGDAQVELCQDGGLYGRRRGRPSGGGGASTAGTGLG